MDHPTCGSGVRWCARADAIFDVPDMHVLEVEVDDEQRLVLTVESGQLEAACPTCGVLAVSHGRRVRMLHDMPCFGRVTLLRWLVRIWRCREPQCATQTFSEAHGLAPPRMALTVRALGWAADALNDDTTVSALARHLGVDWHTCWNAIEVEATARTTDSARLQGVKTPGVDEHIVRHEALLVRMEVGDLDRFAVAAAGWSWRQPVPGETLGSGGSSRDKVRAVRHYRTGRAW
jgi:transposase